MNICIFLLKMLKKNSKKNMLYLISIMVPVVIIFNLMNIITNSKFFAEDASEEIMFLLTLLVCVFTFYSNSYFVMGKSKEMAVIELSGIWPSKLARMLLFENIIIEIISCFIGILIGIAVMPFFLLIMYNIAGKSGSLWMISPSAIWGTIAILALQIGYVTLGDYGYASSREIIDLMNVSKKVRIKDNDISISISQILTTLNLNKKHRVHKSKVYNLKIDNYLIIYLFPIVFVLLSPEHIPVFVAAILSMMCTIYSIPGILKHSIPEKILELKNEKYLDDKIKLISLSNLYTSLKQLKFLIITLVIAIEMLLYFISISNSPRLKAVCIISYVTIILLVAGSILYKIIIETDNKKRTFMQLSLIGYTTDQIKKIIKEEFKLYYSIIISLPLFHILIFFTLFKKSGILPIKLLLLMLFIFLLVFFIVGIVSFNTYKKLALKKVINKFL
ncbi:ABC transporter permease [Clostridium neuense]|uniref:ABC transporter permease n=1 Tax=Clostridium neuense TaxID=1728934 RepID=A0ABW8TJ24_9CLOT